jgi:hypothetical protein
MLVVVLYHIYRPTLLWSCTTSIDQHYSTTVFHATVNEETYITMRKEVLAPYLDNMPLATLQHFWFQKDEAPPHFIVLLVSG